MRTRRVGADSAGFDFAGDLLAGAALGVPYDRLVALAILALRLADDESAAAHILRAVELIVCQL